MDLLVSWWIESRGRHRVRTSRIENRCLHAVRGDRFNISESGNLPPVRTSRLKAAVSMRDAIIYQTMSDLRHIAAYCCGRPIVHTRQHQSFQVVLISMAGDAVLFNLKRNSALLKICRAETDNGIADRLLINE